MMKKLLAAAAVLALSAGSAYAADLALKPAEPVAPLVMPYSWTGFYAGIDAGYQWSSARWENTAIDNRQFNLDPNGALVGLHAGYNYQLENGVVLGAEADIAYSWAKSDDVHSINVDRFWTANSKLDLQGTGRLRVGYAFDRFLPYLTAGIAIARYEVGTGSTFQGPQAYSFKDTRVGWVIGAGVEYAVTDNWSVRAQYLYASYGSKDNDGIPTQFPTAPKVAAFKTDLATHTVSLGLSYKF
jgi:outer membrane immunogenic protein